MKVVIINKKALINKLFYIQLLVFSFLLVYFFYDSNSSKQTISPVNLNQAVQADLNGDGKKESLQQLNSQNKIEAQHPNVFLTAQAVKKWLLHSNRILPL